MARQQCRGCNNSKLYFYNIAKSEISSEPYWCIFQIWRLSSGFCWDRYIFSSRSLSDYCDLNCARARLFLILWSHDMAQMKYAMIPGCNSDESITFFVPYIEDEQHFLAACGYIWWQNQIRNCLVGHRSTKRYFQQWNRGVLDPNIMYCSLWIQDSGRLIFRILVL